MKIIADVTQHIELNLDSPITVESIAKEFGYSRHHFQRLFAHCVGVNVGYYITQRRLMEAARILNATDARIIEIAQTAGYTSQEAFTRAFKNHFNKTPAQYRKEKLQPVLRTFPAFDKEMVHHLSWHKELAQPRFEQKHAMTFVGLSAKMDRQNATSITQDLWKEMNRRSDEITNTYGDPKREHASYGILKDGATADENSTYASFHYAASIEIDPLTTTPHGMERLEIAPQHYAIFEHRGGMDTLHLSNQYIWGVWMAQNDQKVAFSPDLEVYPPSFKPKSNERMEIWIPLEKI